jgi:hypothetical protein
MKKLRNTKGTLEALLVIGLILIIPLFFSFVTKANSPDAPNTDIPLQPTVALSVPDSSDEAKPKQPSACTFPLAQIPTEEYVPEEYIFSQPQVVLTAPAGNPYDIVEWLPNNQQVLMTEGLINAMESAHSP